MAGELDIALRFVHFAAGVTWIGLLYFFNLVNVPFQKELEADQKPKVNPRLLGRTLWWFRHGAWVTVLMGLLLIYRLYMVPTNRLGTDAGIIISLGGLLGIIMMINVWGVIWPSQKRNFAAAAAGTKPDPKWTKNATLASRTNFVLSFPMLLFMAGASHWPGTWTSFAAAGVLVAVLGWGLLWAVQILSLIHI